MNAPLSLQQDVVTLLCFSNKHASYIRNIVEVDLLEGEWQNIAIRVYSYIDKYEKAPGEHLPDLFDDILTGEDKQQADFYTELFLSLYEHRNKVNAEYVLNRISDFIREQDLKRTILDSVDLHEQQGTDAVEDIEQLWLDFLNKRVELFNPGIRLSNTAEALEFFNQIAPPFKTGIKEFDKRGTGPARKELLVFIALPKRGKSWFMVNTGVIGLLQHLKICHITLELSAARTAQRYLQNMFAISKRRAKIFHSRLQLDELGRLYGLEDKMIKPKIALEDPDAHEKLVRKIKTWKGRLNNLVIKEFPSGRLKVRELQNYLDMLERKEQFTPDILIVDYPDLMHKGGDVAYNRITLGRIYEQLRGMAIERNIAVVTATQSNRAGESAEKLTGEHVSEDFSKIATADLVITYSRTAAEKRRKLARLFVANSRTDVDQYTVLVTQNYDIGQFCLDSYYMTNETSYWKMMKNIGEDDASEE